MGKYSWDINRQNDMGEEIICGEIMSKAMELEQGAQLEGCS